LRGIGYKTYVLDNLVAYHYGSQNVRRLPGISEMIERDKENWNLYSYKDIQEIIKEYKK
jgi:hypothetical protein